jgi:hypothetical protein
MLCQAERRTVALSSRVTALEGVQAQLEQQLQLERDACKQELAARQKSERLLADEKFALHEARAAAAESGADAERAQGDLAQTRGEQSAAEEALRIANERGLQQHMEAASTDETIAQLKELRAADQA